MADANTTGPGPPASTRTSIVEAIGQVAAECTFHLTRVRDTATVLAVEDQVAILAKLLGIRNSIRATTQRKSKGVPPPPEGSPGSLLCGFIDKDDTNEGSA